MDGLDGDIFVPIKFFDTIWRGWGLKMSTVAFQKKEVKEVARGGSVGLDLIGSNPIQ